MKFIEKLRVKPGSKVDLGKIDPRYRGGVKSRKAGEERLQENHDALYDLQYRLYAESERALLIVLQGIDASGKDGTIRHVMSCLNPQGCQVSSFKAPSSLELAHDYLWRVHKAMPRWGNIGIFNRSHYEDVLIVRVRNLVPKSVWSQRYDQINAFEKYMTDNGTRIVKFFLYIDADEQKSRFQSRIDRPEKNYKFSSGDIKERARWDDYLKAFEAALEKCSTEYAPWYIIPANRKWFRNLAVSEIMRQTLEEMNPQLPPPREFSRAQIEAWIADDEEGMCRFREGR